MLIILITQKKTTGKNAVGIVKQLVKLCCFLAMWLDVWTNKLADTSRIWDLCDSFLIGLAF